MTIVNLFLSPMKHCEDACCELLASLYVKHNKSYVKRQLIEHPDYPGIIAIADVLGFNYNVSSLPLTISLEAILLEPEILTPFVAHIRGPEHPVFGIVKRISINSILFYNPISKKEEEISMREFTDLYLGTILVVKAEEGAIENGFGKNRNQEKRKNFLQNFLILVPPLFVLVACFGATFSSPDISVIFPISFTILTFIGAITTLLLLWIEIDTYNPTINRICRSGTKTNCSAILNSGASKFFGVSWSLIGFCYFSGMLILLMINGVDSFFILNILSWLNVIALPYIFFSIFYQWRIAKQWCPLCLIVQTVLLLQFFVALLGKFHRILPFQYWTFQALLSVPLIFTMVFIIAMQIVSLLENKLEAREKNIDLKRLKLNPQIFETLLKKQKAVENPSDNLGISMGNPLGICKIVMVCNPYCGPCAKAHLILEELEAGNSELSVQVIFTATENKQDYRNLPVSHLLAINARNDKTMMKNAMADWYGGLAMDYAKFSDKYQVDIDELEQEEKIKNMRKWCDNVVIGFTPTFFIGLNTLDNNNRLFQLPEVYSVSDLKYFLSI